ncbi:MAG TPA: DUF2059 domain-containing protein [Candidatus Angelobacter sp.]|jgi:hypothetical protein|nr:DUF2059 domain-containing protein [Candidatus Angelobacter sp.]
MRCKGLVLLVLLAVAAPVFAQQSVAEAAAQAKSKREVFPADAPTHDQVMTLLDLLQVRRNMVLMIDGMKNAMKEGAERSFRERVPNPTPKQLEALRGMIDGALSEMPLDEMVEATVAVYRRHLTKSDVEEMIRFYAGPVGQKVLQEQPKMLQESMQAGTEIQKKRMDQIIAKIRESEQKMLEADEESNTTPKK